MSTIGQFLKHYTPIASASALGVVKSGTDVSVNGAGALSVTSSDAATANMIVKRNAAGIFAVNSINETMVSVTGTNIDLNAASYFTKTISGPTTLTLSNVPASGKGCNFILDLTNGGSAAITWWSGVKWTDGVAPTLTAAGRDVLGFFTHDGGTSWVGVVLGKDVK